MTHSVPAPSVASSASAWSAVQTTTRSWLRLTFACAAVAAMVGSYWQPFWTFKLYAPQYPHGLTLSISLTGFSGDVREIDMLNHYIGMMRLEAGAAIERELAKYAVFGLAALVLALSVAGRRRALQLAAALGVLYPLGFLADTFYWLYTFGHSLDPRAPLHIPTFTPQLFGNGTIGQFMTYAVPQTGFWLSVASAVLLLAAACLRFGRASRGWRGASCIACALASLGVSADVAARAPSVPGALVQAGPVQLAVPDGAHVVRTADELKRVLADVAGPTRLWLSAGVYQGNFRIARTLELSGERGAILDGAGSGTVLELAADRVRVANLTVRNSGRRQTVEDAGVRAKGTGITLHHIRVENALFGIALGPCPQCVVERCHVWAEHAHAPLAGDAIKLWESNHAVVRGCVVENMRDVVVWYSRHVLLEGNLIRNSRYGAHFMYAHDSTVRDSQIVDNVVGVFVMYSSRLHVIGNVLAGAKGAAGIGIGFKDSDDIQLTGNWIVANTTGAYLDVLPRDGAPLAHFSDNVFALNQVALQFHSMPRGMRFSGNEFRSNGDLLGVEGGGDAMHVEFEHNYYSDYAGFDLDRDGYGDVAHEVVHLSGALIEEQPVLQLLQGTAAMRLLDVIARAAPVFSNRLLMRDPAPMFEPSRRAP